MDYQLIAKEIETMYIAESIVHHYIGKNVKSPGLEKGSHYIIKFWSAKSIAAGDNPYWIGQFLGAGISLDSILADTPRAKELVDNQRYFFKKVNGDIIAAGSYNGALVLNEDSEQRITFYALLGEPQQNALPLAQPATRNDKATPATPARVKRDASASVKQSQTIHKRTPRESNKPELSPEEASEALRMLFKKSEPPTYKTFLVAQFNHKTEAQLFADSIAEGEYVLDGVAHIARAPDSSNEKSEFIAKARELGSVTIYSYKRIMPTKPINVIEENIQ